MSALARLARSAADGLEAPPIAWAARQSNYAWLVVAVTCVGAFIGQLDASIVQLALPVLEATFNSGLSAVSWVAIGYLLAFAAALPIFARLSETSGRKRLYLCGYVVFSVASALCGFAPGLWWLVAFRVAQGIGGAMLGANSVTILVTAAGPDRRGRAMGIFAAAQAVGVGIGPAVGGVLISALGWHWVFWAAVPFGVLGAVASWLLLPRTATLPPKTAFDVRGAALLAPALVAILVVLSEIHAWGLASPGMVIGTAAAVVLLVLFVLQERRAPAPLIDLALLRRPAFAAGILGVMLSYGLLYGMFFLMAFAFVRGDHDTAMTAGLRLAIIPVTLGIAAPFSGTMSERMGARTLTFCGMVVCLVALLLMSHSLASGLSSVAETTGALVLFGLGLGFFISPNNSATLAAAPAQSSGVAGGLLNLLRVFGTSLGVAAASSMLAWRLEMRMGPGSRMSAVPADVLFVACKEAMLVLVAFAVIAGLSSLVRAGKPSARAG